MGTDYDSESGVQVSLSYFAEQFIYDPSGKALAKRVMKSINDCINDNPEVWPVKKVSTQEEVISFWETVTAYEGEAGRYEGDCKFTHWNDNQPYELTKLVDWIGTTEGLPDADCVRIFDSYRQHDEMLVGEPSIIYGSDSVWERSLSSEGKKLEKFAGYLAESSWTDVSY